MTANPTLKMSVIKEKNQQDSLSAEDTIVEELMKILKATETITHVMLAEAGRRHNHSVNIWSNISSLLKGSM